MHWDLRTVGSLHQRNVTCWLGCIPCDYSSPNTRRFDFSSYLRSCSCARKAGYRRYCAFCILIRGKLSKVRTCSVRD